ncbi:MAG TPA: cytochrome c [Gemmatimonadales bacterium]|nr:cytochrome c [Gemmatimonadales bacterium]
MPATALSSRAALSLLASLSGCVAEERTSDTQESAGGPSRTFLAAITNTHPYHTTLDTIPPDSYEGWKQYQLVCSRCHGEEAQGSSFGPSLLASLKPDGGIPSKEAFVQLLVSGRPDQGMPSAKTLGLDPKYFDGMYDYLHGRATGAYKPGRPVKASE